MTTNTEVTTRCFQVGYWELVYFSDALLELRTIYCALQKQRAKDGSW